MTKEELIRRMDKTIVLGKAAKTDAAREIQRKWYKHYKLMLKELEKTVAEQKKLDV